MNTSRSAAARAKPISWVTTTIVIPSPANSSMTSRTSLTISGSRAEVGSSKSITLGSMASDRAMATRCCWPPDSWRGKASALSGMPTRSNWRMAMVTASSLERLRTFRWERVMFSSTVRWGKRLNCWNTMPTSARTWSRSVEASVRMKPSTMTLPLVGISSRLIQRRTVDLPDPLGPTMTTTSPSATSRSTSTTAWMVRLNVLETLLNWIMGLVVIVHPAGHGSSVVRGRRVAVRAQGSGTGR